VFLPLHPAKYAELLGKKLKANPDIKVWLINTGWTSGSYGVGSRIKLSYTRAMITAALNGELDKVKFEELPIFRLQIPTSCSGVPTELLNPRLTWADKSAYDSKATDLASRFIKNFAQYADGASKEILSAAPSVPEIA
jgi:phosphoenolpyruvate carboxykinase (ATP)